jgi:hypothetical protein
VSTLRRIVCGAGLGLILLCAFASTAFATDYAVGSDAKRITVDQAVHPGQRVTLPSFGIYNQGTKPAHYQMTVVAIDGAEGIDPTWVSFEPKEFSLQPGEVSRITATITVPDGARAGTYQALLAGRLASRGQASVGMSVGIGPLVTVRVASGWWLSAAWYKTTGAFNDTAPWSYLGGVVIVLGLLAAGLALLQRRLRRRRLAVAGGPEGERAPEGARELSGSVQGEA